MININDDDLEYIREALKKPASIYRCDLCGLTDPCSKDHIIPGSNSMGQSGTVCQGEMKTFTPR